MLDVAHPFAGSLGPLARRLRLPRAPLPGSMVSLRVAAPSYGAVLRMAVAPGAPEQRRARARGRPERPLLVAAVSRSAGGLARRRADAVSRRRARRSLRARAVAATRLVATRRRRARSSAAPHRRSADARPRSRRRRRRPSSLDPRARRRRRAAPSPNRRCSRTRRAAGSVPLLLVATSRPSAAQTMPSWPATGCRDVDLRRARGIRDGHLIGVLSRRRRASSRRRDGRCRSTARPRANP